MIVALWTATTRGRIYARPYLLPIDFAETDEAVKTNLKSRAEAKAHMMKGGCLIIFPAGGVCHGATAVEAFKRLREIVEDTVATAKARRLKLPPPRTRPMREVELAM